MFKVIYFHNKKLYSVVFNNSQDVVEFLNRRSTESYYILKKDNKICKYVESNDFSFRSQEVWIQRENSKISKKNLFKIIFSVETILMADNVIDLIKILNHSKEFILLELSPSGKYFEIPWFKYLNKVEKIIWKYK